MSLRLWGKKAIVAPPCVAGRGRRLGWVFSMIEMSVAALFCTALLTQNTLEAQHS
jgi:hypothetical protein